MLLGDAVQGAEAQDEVAGVDWDDGEGGEELFEDFESGYVGGIVEDGDEYADVCDGEVGVTGGEALFAEIDGFGHWEFGDGELFAVGVSHFF